MKTTTNVILLTVLFIFASPLWAADSTNSGYASKIAAEEVDAHVIDGNTCLLTAQKISAKNGNVGPQNTNPIDSKNPDLTQHLGGIDISGEWVEYYIDVQQGGSYTLYPRLATTNSTWAFNVKIDGVQAASFTDGQTGGWNVWTTIRYKKQTITLDAGIHTLRLEFTTGKLNLNILYFEYDDEPLMDAHVINGTGISRIIAARDIFDKHASITFANSNDTGEPDATRALNNIDADNGNWIEYPIDVQQGGSYKIYPRLATTNGAWAFDVDIDDTQKASFTGGTTGGWSTWVTKNDLAQSVNLAAGIHALRLRFTEQKLNLNILYFEYDDTATSLAENQLENDVKIYPNPVQRGQEIQIDAQLRQGETNRIDLYDLTGKRVASFEITGNRTYLPATINSGLYLLKITGKELDKEAKIVVL